MSNNDNLIRPEEINARLTPEERSKNAKKANRESRKAARRNKTAREILSHLLSLPISEGKATDKFKSVKDIGGKNLTALTAGLANLTKDVINGDKKAIELALRITGEMTEQIQIQTTDENIEALKELLNKEN